MDTAKLSTKGQLVIPNKIRRALHLQPGDTVKLALEGSRIIIEPQRHERARLVKSGRRKVLVAPAGAPPMTPENVKALLADLP